MKLFLKKNISYGVTHQQGEIRDLNLFVLSEIQDRFISEL